MAIVKLSRAVEFEGATYTEIEMNLEGMTGDDIIKAERECLTSGIPMGVAETSKGFLMAVAARACKMPVEFIHALPIKDATKITMEVQSFLLG